MYALILAAGIGSRLGAPLPKPLTQLANGERILDRQLAQLRQRIDPERIVVVVGFKKELIMEAHPSLLYLYNASFDVTNTAASLALALRKTADADVLMLNGDVVCDAQVLDRLLSANSSAMAVNQAAVGAEEVKYRLDATGRISEVSKQIATARGEALGINLFRGADIPRLRAGLDRCTPEDYFERGIEYAIAAGLRIWPVDVSDLHCIEVDFPDDLARAGRELAPVAG